MKNMKLKRKLLVSFLAVAIITSIVGIAGVIGLLALNANEDTLYNSMFSANCARALSANIQEQRVLFRDVVMNADNKVKLDSTATRWNEVQTEYAELFSYLDTHIEKEEARKTLPEISRAYDDYMTIVGELMQAIQNNNAAGQVEQWLARALQPVNTIIASIDAMNEYATMVCTQTNDDDARTAHALTVAVGLLTCIALLSAVGLGLYNANLISNPISALTAFMNKAGETGDISLAEEDRELIGKYAARKDEIGQCIGSTASFITRVIAIGGNLETVANGDFTADVNLLSDRDTMGLSLQKMMHNLNRMFGEINASTARVSAGSKQIADGAQSLAQGSTQQASAIEELSASVREITDKTKQNSEIAKEAAALSGAIKNSAETGNAQMDQMMQSVKEINEASNQISKVIKVIDDIAFQTNILALNAAVEAARAGQYGKGFAVVAEEVRNLAAKSAAAAKDTGELIENSMQKANFGLAIATDTSSSLKEIVDGINRSAEIVAQIARSSEEQAGAIAQINIGIGQVEQVVQHNSATAEESAAASEEMNGQFDRLEQLISQFKLKISASTSSFHATSHKKPLAMPQEKAISFAGHNGEYGKY